MKDQEHVKGNASVQGGSTSDRNFNDLKEANEQRGGNNGDGQRSDQAWNRNSVHKPKRRML
ncbi:hypothetical protein [Mucilaginibacter polytrichastri]|uniref:Uncharacterized protein n=1 Tax=Mucilaginibacter polytrichastri TaxID=1302689 RepID=A0A1Q5ZXU4_9SPHI|nr:hypothetical protein [Mucilaginibacter polytrichastri]OKS86558.1 hypothetical protein RG47T_2014 [Mucilaginibacter polytrichastri]SFS80045.1 hypothetical protein SAMN04487890_104130 [Mucilaginibacter polytrichastri]